MDNTGILLILFTVIELVLLGVVTAFFMRLKKSEALVSTLQERQEEFLNRLQFNAQLEQELVQSFQQRQKQLTALDEQLETQAKRLEKLLAQAREYSKSPSFLRQIILSGHKEGASPERLAKSTGLSLEEVQLIIDQAG
ncbi:hypothetical protein SAMN02745704_02006 [Paucidesulfovibrio gracilis DSM 16080]|uniref:DUF2802 domain-containing protein n=1 Tax=Paucidesulfovibrio gracilis DSM 16080 TaxID=1121449 RepID=A0A1T4XAY8_9BACT|nr:hypothetical protein [Paucidesulfovibrio gracilis]SKA86792.1 hypothetical protein SAMN02745704_02006 [Paucidesulfovibrio gracilis DSM 16080]